VKILLVAFGMALAGYGLIAAEQSSETVHKDGLPAAKKVYVKYHGPERLTRRFSRFFEIAADDQITLANKPREADAQMEVSISEEDTHVSINGKILHLGFLLHGGQRTTLHYCESTSESSDSSNRDISVLFGLLSAKSLTGELKKRQPKVSTVYVNLIRGNVDPLVADAIKAEFAQGDFHPAANAASADAVLRTMGATVEPIELSGTRRKLSIEISGAATYSSERTQIRYKSIDGAASEKFQPCLESLKSYLNRGQQDDTDNFWTGAAAAARALAKR
jgi:hypothetical protein